MGESISFGYWVRRRRKALDMTQADLGRRVGASEAMIRKIEADERRPSRELAELLADQLAVAADERAAFLRAARDIAAMQMIPLPAGPVVSTPPALPPPSNLPAPVTSMINRVNDLSAVTALLGRDDVRLVTLLGPPGMGKTRLSIRTAEEMLPRFPDGVWFVDLSAVLDPALVLPAIALAFNLTLVPGKPAFDQLILELQNKTLLLVLDNFEQVVEGASLELAGLLRGCKHLKVLVTSRVRLDIYGEFEYPLPPMSLPPEDRRATPAELLDYEAVQLFVARTRQHQPGFELSAETAGPVVEICRHMDGLPLALELAAARTRRMPVTELAGALREASGRDWHALLHTSARDLPPRQQTLFNAVAWSYSLLEPPSQAMFAQLSVFAEPFDWPAVVAVVDVPELSDETVKREALERLADHNLVSKVSASPDHWRLLEMIREFALDQLNAVSKFAVSERHAQYYAGVLTDLGQRVSGKAYHAAVNAVADNCRAALHWSLNVSNARLAYRLCAAFEWYWEQRGLLREGRYFLEKTLALPEEVDDDLRFDVLHGAANLAWMQHDLDVAHRHSAAGLALAYERNDIARVAGFLNHQARIFLEEGRYEDADRALVEGIRLGHMHLRDLNPRFMIIQRGEAALGMGRIERAEVLLRDGLDGVSPNHVIPFCVGWTNLAEVALAKGDRDTARDALLRVAPLASLHTRRLRAFLVSVSGFALLGQAGKSRENIASLLGYVVEANQRVGDPLSPMLRYLLEERVAAARQLLAPDAWQAAWGVGQHWTAEKALTVTAEILDASH